ncbi:MAG: hypothetical protein OXF26_13160, partial [Alphaproteobacteria bacterium]|nr:hypothetical protein [Alphaproteobacteria bacterium]
QRIRLPGGRYERFEARHTWSAAYRVSNWVYYNAQRHADHHTAAGRLYALLKHSGPDEAPQLPGTYAKMGNMVLFPRRWFRTMDPLVERWRTHFYPEIDDWSAYDSAAYAARPDAFEAIAEIFAAAPRMGAWIDDDPGLLDYLQTREFTELDLPEGFGPDSEFETVARCGLTRVYWTHEFDVPQMKEQLAELPFKDAREAAVAARNWSNGKVFQISMHTMRGNLSPVEAGTALSNVAEASVTQVLTVVAEEFAERRAGGPESKVAAVLIGEISSGEAAPGADLDVLFLNDGSSADYADALCRRFDEALCGLSRDSLLFAPLPHKRKTWTVRSLAEFQAHHRTAASAAEFRALFRARCVFAAGDPGLVTRFDEARREALTHGIAREALIAELRESSGNATEPDPRHVDVLRGGFRDVEGAARIQQLIHAEACPEALVPGIASAFRTLGTHGLIPADTAGSLEETATMWRNLRGILPLVMRDDCPADTAGSKVNATIARACGLDDFDVLEYNIRDTAYRATTDIAALEGRSA